MRLIDLDAAIDAITRIKIKDVYDEKHAKGITVGLLSAIDELERLPAVNRWIPVTERLPEIGQYVICQCKQNVIKVMKLERDGDWFHDGRHIYMHEFVVAWMSLPEPWREEE